MHTATWTLCSFALLSTSAYGDAFSFLSRRKTIDPPPKESNEGGASLIELGDADEGEAVTASSADSGDGQEAVNLMQEVQGTSTKEVKKEDFISSQTEKANKEHNLPEKRKKGETEPETVAEPEKEIASSMKESVVEKEFPSKVEEQQQLQTHSTGEVFLEKEKGEPAIVIEEPKPEAPSAATEVKTQTSATQVKADTVPSAGSEVKAETVSSAATEVKVEQATVTKPESETGANTESEVRKAGTAVPDTLVGEEKQITSTQATVKVESPSVPASDAGLKWEPQAPGTETSSEAVVKLETSAVSPDTVAGLEGIACTGSNILALANSTPSPLPSSAPGVKTEGLLRGAVQSKAESTGTVKSEMPGSSEVKPETITMEAKAEVNIESAAKGSMPSEAAPEVSGEVKSESAVQQSIPSDVSAQVKSESAVQSNMPSEVSGKVKIESTEAETEGVAKMEGAVKSEGQWETPRWDVDESGVDFDAEEVPTIQVSEDKDIGKKKVGVDFNLHGHNTFIY